MKADLTPLVNIIKTKGNEKNKLSIKSIVDAILRPAGFSMIILCAISVCSIKYL